MIKCYYVLLEYTVRGECEKMSMVDIPTSDNTVYDT